MDLFPNTRDYFKEDLIMLQNTAIKQLLDVSFFFFVIFFFFHNVLPHSGKFSVSDRHFLWSFLQGMG